LGEIFSSLPAFSDQPCCSLFHINLLQCTIDAHWLHHLHGAAASAWRCRHCCCRCGEAL
jgi:hypothetical protein